eukprot:maker-scaffold_10-snap-gene-12.12-mRNA-1 protein AED:0.05 eAED:0.05 QI:131/0.33/0.25/0.75/1/1/4/0/387
MNKQDLLSEEWGSFPRVWYKQQVTHLCKDITLHYRFPDPMEYDLTNETTWSENGRVLIHVPGRGRDVELFKSKARGELADEQNVVLLSLELKEEENLLDSSECPNKKDRYRNFPDGFGYQYGNVGELDREKRIWKTAFDRENYVFEHIENAFYTFEKELNIKFSEVFYFGFSAGGQVVNRHLLLGNSTFFEERVTKVCASSPLHYTFPITSEQYGGRYPYSLVQTPVLDSTNNLFDDQFIQQAIENFPFLFDKVNVLLTVGGKDNFKIGEYDELLKEGEGRLQRLEAYFDLALSKAETIHFLNHSFLDRAEFENSFRWSKSIIDGVDHDKYQMSKACWNYFFDTELEIDAESSLFSHPVFYVEEIYPAVERKKQNSNQKLLTDLPIY